jgi:hypothetical protein
VLKVETTPSGNVSYVMNGKDVFQEHWLFKEGELQTQSQRSIQTTSGRCGSWSYTCVLTVQMHFVNGEVEVRKDDFVCTDSPSG